MAWDKTAYSEKLKDPRWQKMRLQILERDNWQCQRCGDEKSTLHVHHFYYTNGCEPWEYPPEALITLCEECHGVETDERPEMERRLLRAMKVCRLKYDEVWALMDGFENAKFSPSVGAVLMTLREILVNPELQNETVRNFFSIPPSV